MKAYIYLENGIYMEAKAFGKGGSAFGELVFNTSLTGYEEIITDPSYAGQFIVFTMPEIGIVGINDDATFANYREARFHFWEDTVIPYIDYILDALNTYIAERFRTDLKLSYDKDKIDALIPRRDAIWNAITNSDFLTINEKREALGYLPIE